MMMRNVLMAEATGDPAGGALPATPSTATPIAPAAPAAPATPAAPAAPAMPAAPTLLQQAVTAAGGDPPTIPDKYKVMGADGKLDVAATLAKVTPAYVALEKRMGEGGAPPEKPDGYKTEAVVSKLKEANGGKDVQLPAELTASFAEWAHASKMSQGQFEQSLAGFVSVIPKMVDAAFDSAMARGTEELTKAWGPDGVKPTSAKMKAAANAFNRFAPEALRTQETLGKIGSHPVVMQILAAVGEQLSEDKTPNGEAPGLATELDQLYASKAYWNKKDPTHDATVARVQELMKGGARPAATRGRQAVKL